MQCPSRDCGATVDEGERVCPRCGSALQSPPPGRNEGEHFVEEVAAQASGLSRVRRYAVTSLSLALLTFPVLWPAFWIAIIYLRRAIASPTQNLSSPPLFSFAVIIVTGAVAAIVTGHMAMAMGRRAPSIGKVSRRAVFGTLLGYFNIAALIAIALTSFYGKWRPNLDMSACIHNLWYIQVVFREYAEENRGAFPPLSSQPGVLMFSPDAIHRGDEIGKFLTCPTIRYAKQRTTGAASPFDDQSYFYLGYAVRNDEAVKAFAKAYRKRVSEGGTFDHDLVVEDAQGTHTLHRLAKNSKEILRASQDALSVSPYEGHSPAHQSKCVTDDVPILIERDLGHRNIDAIDAPEFEGAWVLYLNDGLQFIERGTWPVTEETQRILAELAE